MAELEIEIRTQTVGGVPAVHLWGELDAGSAPRLQSLLESLLVPERPRVMILLSGLSYMDSTGLGVLVAGLKQATDRSGTLALVAPSPPVARVLRITSLDRLFRIFPHEAAARAYLCPQPPN